MAERLTALCANPFKIQLVDLQQAREVIEALAFNYVNYDPDTHSYGVVSPPMPSLEAVEGALGNVLRERFDKGCWDSVVYRCLGDHQNDVNWEMIMDEFAAAIKENAFKDNPVPRMGEIVTALFQAAGEMKDEEMRGYSRARKLFRKALDIAGLLADDDVNTETIAKALTTAVRKRSSMLAELIAVRADSVNWEDISGELENLTTERQVMAENVIQHMDGFVDAVVARANTVQEDPFFFDALETASDIAEYLVRYALCAIDCAWFRAEPLI